MMSRSIPYPHHVDHEKKVVSIYFEAGFPGLRFALGVVQQFGLLGEVVEVVPLVFEEANLPAVFLLQSDPIGVVQSSLEELIELFAHFPVR